jgi:hypothetical protein
MAEAIGHMTHERASGCLAIPPAPATTIPLPASLFCIRAPTVCYGPPLG